jgi:hypothetical protein
MYRDLSNLRHDMTRVPHYEPIGDETFDRAVSIPGARRTS